MEKMVHDGNRWRRQPKFIFLGLLHFPSHILNIFGCRDDCPFNNPVIFRDPQAVTIEDEIDIGAGTIFERCVHLAGPTVIGKRCRIGPHVTIKNCFIGDHVAIGHGAQLKKCRIGNQVRMPHVGYLGDTWVGEETNIGAGTEAKIGGTEERNPGKGVIASNWDGLEKRKTIIGPRCFVGTYVDFIAPLTIGEECFIASRTRVAAKNPIPPHSFVFEEIQNGRARTAWRENCSFKLPHTWGWIWTRRPIAPERMTRLFSILKLYLGEYDQWLCQPHPKLNGQKPRTILNFQGEEGLETLFLLIEKGDLS